MRLRFFFTILAVLLLTVLAVSGVHFYFFHNERLRLIDQQIQGIASSLYSSELSSAKLEDIGEAEDIISDVLDLDKVKAIITVYGSSGRVIYRNKDFTFLSHPPPLEPRWQTISSEDHTVRVLNLPLPVKKRILQVALLLDQGQIHWRTLSYTVFFYLGFIVLFMLTSATLLTSLLLNPLRSLADYLRHLAEPTGISLSDQSPAAAMPLKFAKRSAQPLARFDQFADLISAIQDLSAKIYSQMLTTQAWTAQMAHEIKTPLTIVRNCIELAADPSHSTDAPRLLTEARNEIDYLGGVVSGFLDWAHTENTPGRDDDLHAIRLKNLIMEMVEKLNRVHAKRIQLKEPVEDIRIFAKPELAAQVFSNILQNAIDHSPATKAIVVTLNNNCFAVKDNGAGIPEKVLDRLGQPFNCGDQKTDHNRRSSGLGLARIKTICTKYEWDLRLESTPQGSTVSVSFNREK